MLIRSICRRLANSLRRTHSGDAKPTPASKESKQIKKAPREIKASAEADLESLKDDLREEKARASKAEAAAEACASRIEGLNKQLQDEQARAQLTNAQVTSERDHIQRLLDDKTAHNEQLLRESAAAQQWLSIRDDLTDSQIVSDVEGINYDIGNVAATVSEAFVDALPPGAPFRASLPPSFHPSFSSHIIDAFNVANHREDSLLLEIVIQAVLVAFALDVSLRWDISNRALQSSLDRTFEGIYHEELAGISGNWKVLTHRYMNPSHATSITLKDDPLYQSLLSPLLLLASALHLDPVDSTRLVEESVGDALRDLLLSVRKLNRNLAEGITSCLLIPVLVESGTPYDSSMMKNGTGGADEQPFSERASVLCTTGLGLKRRMRMDHGGVDEKLLILPTVALRNVLDMLPQVSSDLHHDTSSLSF